MNLHGNSKKKAERKHAKKRIRSRFGVNVSTETLRKAIADIQAQPPNGKFLGRQSVNKSWWEVSIHEIQMSVLYDKQRKEIVTVLPANAEIWGLLPD